VLDASATKSSPLHLSHAATATDTKIYPPIDGSPTEDRKPKKRKLIENGDESKDTHFIVYQNGVRENAHLKVVFEDIKKECGILVELCDQVKLWVNLTMPKIEDGDNFGVQIQEEVLSELHRSQEAAFGVRDGVRSHYLSRAKICSKMIKYPNLPDYPTALIEHDEKQLYMAKQHLISIRNIYAVLTDILHKNIAKIRAPKGNNSAGLY